MQMSQRQQGLIVVVLVLTGIGAAFVLMRPANTPDSSKSESLAVADSTPTNVPLSSLLDDVGNVQGELRVPVEASAPPPAADLPSEAALGRKRLEQLSMQFQMLEDAWRQNSFGELERAYSVVSLAVMVDMDLTGAFIDAQGKPVRFRNQPGHHNFSSAGRFYDVELARYPILMELLEIERDWKVNSAKLHDPMDQSKGLPIAPALSTSQRQQVVEIYERALQQLGHVR